MPRQRIKQSAAAYYHIYPLGGVRQFFYDEEQLHGNRIYLSCTPNGGKVDLWFEDDETGRQKWILQYVGYNDANGNGIYYIKIRNGTDNNVRYLSVQSDGINTELIDGDGGLNKLQEWILEQVTNEEWFYIYTNAFPIVYHRYLSANNSNLRVDLAQADDGSGRQRWILELNDQGYVHFINICDFINVRFRL